MDSLTTMEQIVKLRRLSRDLMAESRLQARGSVERKHLTALAHSAALRAAALGGST